MAPERLQSGPQDCWPWMSQQSKTSSQKVQFSASQLLSNASKDWVEKAAASPQSPRHGPVPCSGHPQRTGSPMPPWLPPPCSPPILQRHPLLLALTQEGPFRGFDAAVFTGLKHSPKFFKPCSCLLSSLLAFHFCLRIPTGRDRKGCPAPSASTSLQEDV